MAQLQPNFHNFYSGHRIVQQLYELVTFFQIIGFVRFQKSLGFGGKKSKIFSLKKNTRMAIQFKIAEININDFIGFHFKNDFFETVFASTNGVFVICTARSIAVNRGILL